MSREQRTRWSGVGLIALVLLVAFLWRMGRGDPSLAVAEGAAPDASAPPPRRVAVRSPERRTIRRTTRLPADILAWQEATLFSRVTGYVKSVSVDIGSRVEKNVPLAELDVPDLEAALEGARSRLIEASARVLQAKSALESAGAAARQAAAETSAASTAIKRMEAEERKARAEAGYREAARERMDAAVASNPNLLSRDAVEEARGKADVAKAAFEVASAQVEEARSLATVAKSREAAASAHVEAADAAVQEARGAELSARVSIVEAEKTLGFATIRAPFAGVVTQRWVDVGDLVRTGTGATKDGGLLRVADGSKVRVRFRVAAPDAPYCKPGNSFRLVVDEVPGREFKSVVSRTAEALDSDTRTLRAEGDIDNAAGTLRPGMFGRVVLDLETHEGAIVLPAEAITTVKRKSSVLVVEDAKVQKRGIKIGADDGISVEVLDGLKGGESVVTAGKDLVSEGERVDAVPEAAR